MSGPISDDRQAILDALPASAGTPYNYVPDRLLPPAAMALWAGLDRNPGDRFGKWTTTFNLWLIRDTGPNSVVTDALDTVAWDTIQALHAEGFTVTGISEPFTYTPAGGGPFLAVIVYVTSGLTVN